MKFSKAAYKLILEEEGMDQPSKWPGESSGITIGHGYDLGYTDPDRLRGDWGDYLEEQEIERLSSACGRTGDAAHAIAPRFHDIHIEREDADEVFRQVTIPHWFEQTRKALPGLEALPLDAQGALVSLVFNRGPAMAGDRRREMRNVRELVPLKDLAGIAAQLRSMQRLWPNAKGLRLRREHEAELLERSTAAPNEAIETEDEEEDSA